MVMLGACDTETTGIAFNQGCKPFLVDIAMCDTTAEDGSNERLTCEWDVDPSSRKVIIRKKDLREIVDVLNDPDITWAFHNAKFDVRAIDRACQSVGVDFDPIAFLRRVHDTCCMSHALDSSGSHKLKDLGLLYCDIDTDDETELREVVAAARRYGKSQGWAVAGFDTMPWHQRAPKSVEGTEGWWVCDMWLPRAMAKHKNLPTDDPAWRVCSRYCGMDVERTLMLYLVLTSALEDEPELIPNYELQRSQLVVTFDMEEFGVSLNDADLSNEIKRITKIKDEYGDKAKKLTGDPEFNLNSSPQKQRYLYEDLKLVPFKVTEAGNPSTDAEALDKLKESLLEHEDTLNKRERAALDFCEAYGIYSKCNTAAKYLTGYYAVSNIRIDTERDWRIIYPSFNITGTQTVRFSSSNPNLQNVGKGKDAFEDYGYLNLSLRKVFGPAPGREWWAVDYDQLQLAIFAFASAEPAMMEAIRAGYDFHDFMARSIFDVPKGEKPTDGQRRIGKNVNFGFIFGAGPDKIERTARKPGLYELLGEMFPNAIDFISKNKYKAKIDGYIYTMGGYKLNVPSRQSYAATNYIVQGTEGEMVKSAMYACWEYLYDNVPDGRLCLNVHDEIIFDFPVGEGDQHIRHLCDLMEENGAKYGVDCTVGAKYIDTNWASGVDVEFVQAV